VQSCPPPPRSAVDLKVPIATRNNIRSGFRDPVHSQFDDAIACDRRANRCVQCFAVCAFRYAALRSRHITPCRNVAPGKSRATFPFPTTASPKNASDQTSGTSSKQDRWSWHGAAQPFFAGPTGKPAQLLGRAPFFAEVRAGFASANRFLGSATSAIALRGLCDYVHALNAAAQIR